MGWLSFLTGGSKTAETVVDGAVNGLDAMFFTNEEKSVANQKILDWKLDYAKATAGMSISRRIIVCGVVTAWMILVLLMIVMGTWMGGEHDNVRFLFKVMKEIVATPFAIIVGFYFAAHLLSKGKGNP